MKNKVKDKIVLTKEEYEELLARPLNTMGDLVISKIKNKDYELIKKENYDKLCHLAYFGYEDVKEQTRKEIYQELKYPKSEEMIEFFINHNAKVRKETAEKIINELLDVEVRDNDFKLFFEDICEKLEKFADKYGVEIKG